MLMTLERKIVRKIYGPTKKNGQWRIKTNLELMTKYESQDIVRVIKFRSLEWIGNIIRINETRFVKKIFEGKLEGRRGRGRPRLRWIDDVEDDLTLNIPSLGRQRCLPSCGPRRTPWFSCNFSNV